jgi:small-conductance mechanosensitive channel/CRP-like cAMP-binding protein
VIPQLYSGYTVAGVAVLAAAAALFAFTPNRVVRGRLRLTIVLLVVLVGLHLARAWSLLPPQAHTQIASIERLLFALALIQLVVLVAINPLRHDRVPERFPTIVQDALVIGIFLIVSTFVLDEKFLTTSAVGAVVVGFALQDTLGNMFAGLAIQVEKPFRIGHWVSAGDWEGFVTEITWRATKIRTRYDNLVVVPNSELAKVAITNHSEPAMPTRIHVEVGASYAAPPTLVKRTLEEVLHAEPMVLKTPAPLVLLQKFGDSSIVYRANFWIRERVLDEVVLDKVQCGIYYAFGRAGIEIPYPIQIEYSRSEHVEPDADRLGRVEQLLGEVALFALLDDEERRQLAGDALERTHGSGEAIVSQGDAGSSAFIVASGRVRVTIDPGDSEVATLGPGGLFGEMSLLTGESRTATVRAIGDCRVVEVTADAFRSIALRNPGVLDAVTAEVTRRRTELAAAREAAARERIPVEPSVKLLARIRAFLLGAGLRAG